MNSRSVDWSENGGGGLEGRPASREKELWRFIVGKWGGGLCKQLSPLDPANVRLELPGGLWVRESREPGMPFPGEGKA